MRHIIPVVLLSLAVVPLAAQKDDIIPLDKVVRSQRGSVAQKIANTDITIEYGRPVARGRALFGALVPYGRIWHPGADQGSTFAVTREVQVNGQPLAAVAVALGREDLVVARRLEHGLVAGQDPVASVRLGPCDRRLLAQRAVGPDRIGGVLVGVVVEVDHRAAAGLCHRCSPLEGVPY